ncbi:MAG: sigma-54-dependent transcriptional regulator [Thermoanaerobaculales bacterium]
MTHGSILVVDDEPGIRVQLEAILRDEGFGVTSVSCGEDALAAVSHELYDLIMLDIWLPGIDGIDTLRQLRAAGHQAPVVVISGHANAEMAARAVREGAVDFLEKPLALERVVVTVSNALDRARLERRLAAEREEEDPLLTGVSAAVVELRRQIMLIAPTDSRVLVSGPNGAGKEVVARLLHRHSRRAGGPFVAVNCAAIPSELIESELFGHLKGAFTGAVESKRGKFELADSGTLFLDEIGDMSLLTQAKVLRVLQESRFTRLGGAHEVRVDVRVITATNKDLDEEIRGGRFRQDLLFRLNVVPMRVPTLAERQEDIPLLVEEFMRHISRRTGVRPKRVTPAAMRLLQGHAWPGNVRELRNLVERLMIMVAGEEVEPNHLELPPPAAQAHGDGAFVELREAREQFEREYVGRVLAACDGNMSRAARVLGLERSHLYRKLRSLRVRAR